ncbi:MAG: hypothetical protein WDO14_06805 [Bacteroidota bacterium]
MTTKKKKKADEEFPGYPKYGAEEDITRNSSRIDENLDDEVLTQVKHHEEPKGSKPADKGDTTKAIKSEPLDEVEENTKTSFDVTEEDLEALGDEQLSNDGGDDEQLAHRNRPVDFTGEDLDTPGTELDDDQEEVGSEDEENNNYSVGGDDKENLTEGQEYEGSV